MFKTLTTNNASLINCSPLMTQTVALNRNLVGLMAIGCYAGAVGCYVFKLDNENQIWLASFVRTALVLAAFWFAMASKKREAAWANVSPWTFVGLLLAVFIIPRRPRVFIPMFAVLAVIGYFLRPKNKRRRR